MNVKLYRDQNIDQNLDLITHAALPSKHSRRTREVASSIQDSHDLEDISTALLSRANGSP